MVGHPARLQAFLYCALVVGVAFLENERLVSLGFDGQVLTWDTRVGQEYRVISRKAFGGSTFAFAPGGQRFVAGLRPL